VGHTALSIAQLAPGDVRLGSCDVIVLGATVDRSRLNEVVREAAAGPIAIVEFDDEWQSQLVHVCDVVDRRSDVIRASAALAQLDDDVRQAGSMALSQSWMRVREQVEKLRIDVPAFNELAALRAHVAGRVVLPPARGAALRRILFEVDTAERLGLDPAATDADLLAAAVEQLGEWRAFQDSGRVPFTSRTAFETVVRGLELLWAGLSGYTTES
jgi:hypothetical protein